MALIAGFYGSRRMTAWLITDIRSTASAGFGCGLEAIYRRPNTSKQTQGGLSVLAQGAGDQPQPGVGHRHHLHTHGSGFHILGGHHGLAQPLRAGLAAVQHPGGRLLCCGSGRGLEHIFHRPGQPVHQRGLHQHAAGATFK